MTTCLVFGGGGFLGSHIARGLIEKGYNVRVFDSFPAGMANLEIIRDRLEIIKGDFLNEQDVSNALEDVDYLFHYISTTVPATAKKDPVYDIESNVIGAVKLFQQALNYKIKKVIFPSSGGTVYGEPLSLPIRETDPLNPAEPYAIAKAAIERYLQYFYNTYGLDYNIIRYSNPYGEGQNPHGQQGVIPIFLNKIRQGERPVIYGDGSMIRDYIYITDAVNATIAVIEKQTNERLFNVGSGEGTSINQLIDIMSIITGKKIQPEYVKNGRAYIQRIVLDISKVRGEVGWKPRTNLQDGMKKTWDWINRLP